MFYCCDDSRGIKSKYDPKRNNNGGFYVFLCMKKSIEKTLMVLALAYLGYNIHFIDPLLSESERRDIINSTDTMGLESKEIYDNVSEFTSCLLQYDCKFNVDISDVPSSNRNTRSLFIATDGDSIISLTIRGIINYIERDITSVDIFDLDILKSISKKETYLYN